MLQKLGLHGESKREESYIKYTPKRGAKVKYQGVFCLYFHENSFSH